MPFLVCELCKREFEQTRMGGMPPKICGRLECKRLRQRNYNKIRIAASRPKTKWNFSTKGRTNIKNNGQEFQPPLTSLLFQQEGSMASWR